MPVALVTGSSTGIGLATALHLARNGYETYATMRNPAAGDGVRDPAQAEGLPLHVLQLDVDDGASVTAAIGDAVARSGPIDVLVNNAGIGAGRSIEDSSDKELRGVFETNFFGALRMVREVLPSMRERRTGAIVNVTSMGGRITAQSRGAYCATKWALEAASESLAMEVAPFGVRVAIIEPGVVLTPIFRKPGIEPMAQDSPYGEANRRFVMATLPLLKEPTMPEECAEVILRAITTDTPRLRYTVGSEAESMIQNRAAMTDEEWIALANAEDERDYIAGMAKMWGDKGRLFTPTGD